MSAVSIPSMSLSGQWKRWMLFARNAGMLPTKRLNDHPQKRGKPRADDRNAAMVHDARKAASEIRGAAYSLGKAPEHLTENQKIRLNMIQANDPQLFRAYRLKESLRLLLKSTDVDQAEEDLKHWLFWASHSRIPAFKELYKKIRRLCLWQLQLVTLSLIKSLTKWEGSKMDAITRKTKLDELKGNQLNIAMTGIPLRYKGTTRTEIVYRIPLDYLVYNKYNGRIGSDVLSYEKQNGVLNAELNDDKAIIEKFLYESKVDRNKTTMDSLLKNGQQRYGIVTSDGTIVDGNRRAMLLNRLFHKRDELRYSYEEVEKCKYFLAIILPDDAEEKDIQQLETIYQMGEDDKLDYNPIEKYLKCKELKPQYSPCLARNQKDGNQDKHLKHPSR
mgnify:CR=1 FL=1